MDRSVESAITRNEISEHAFAAHGSYMGGRLSDIFDKFPTVAAILAADKASVLRAYRLSSPNAQRDLGKKTFAAFDEVVSWAKDRILEVNKLRDDRERAEAERIEREHRENPMFSIGEVKALASFMELCGIAEIDLKGIKEIFSKMKVSIGGKN